MHFWCNICVLCQILNIPIKFGDDWFNNKEMATDFRNSRWRRPPSWNLHFRLNRHYEKGTSGLLLPIKNLTCVGLFWCLWVVYSRGLQCWSDFRCKSAKSENGSKFWCFLGRRPPKSEFDGSKPTNGTCTNQNTSFELLKVWICSELRPVGEMSKRKNINKENKSHKTVIFHHCVEVPPGNQSQPKLAYL